MFRLGIGKCPEDSQEAFLAYVSGCFVGVLHLMVCNPCLRLVVYSLGLGLVVPPLVVAPPDALMSILCMVLGE